MPTHHSFPFPVLLKERVGKITIAKLPVLLQARAGGLQEHGHLSEIARLNLADGHTLQMPVSKWPTGISSGQHIERC